MVLFVPRQGANYVNERPLRRRKFAFLSTGASAELQLGGYDRARRLPRARTHTHTHTCPPSCSWAATTAPGARRARALRHTL